MLSLVGLMASPAQLPDLFRSSLCRTVCLWLRTLRSPSGDDLRNYTLEHLNLARQTEYEQLIVRMETRSKTQKPCNMCGSPTSGWVCPRCYRLCKHPIGQTINGWIRCNNGARQAWQRCRRCGRMSKPLPKGATIFDLCLRNNVTDGTPPCDRCGSTTGTETHHWAPEAIFEDSDEWPVAYLCRPCHGLWHQAMEKAGGVRLPTRVMAAPPPDAA